MWQQRPTIGNSARDTAHYFVHTLVDQPGRSKMHVHFWPWLASSTWWALAMLL